MKPPKSRVLAPKIVSYHTYSKRGYVCDGTRAFVPAGTRLSKGLSKEQKWAALRKLAHNSDYFTKPLSARNKQIRAVLEKYGVRVEKVVQELGNGRALFARGDTLSLASRKGLAVFRKDPKKCATNLCDAFAKLFLLEVTHDHPHLGNFAMSPDGQITVLDLGRARMGKPEEIRGPEFRMHERTRYRMARDLHSFLDSLAAYYTRAVMRKRPNRAEFESFRAMLSERVGERVAFWEGKIKEKILKG